MAAYTRKADKHEWEWQSGNKHHAVRYFLETQTLVWSGWMFTSNGPVFEQGHKQTVDDFLVNGITHKSAPPELLEELRATITRADNADTGKKRGLFGLFKR
jgi:hypothetical protein